MTAHECPVRGCSAVVDDARLMCKPHWFAVPGILRREIWGAYRKRDAGILRRLHVAAIRHVNDELAAV
jgi:hypothetical protein